MVKGCEEPGKGWNHILISDFYEHEPAVIPTSRALRICNDHPLGLVQALRAEGVVLRQTT